MKKVSFLLCAVLPFIAACSNDDNATVSPTPEEQQLPSTEVFVQGQTLNYSLTRSGEGDPVSETEEARFFIRIDGRIPGYTNQNPLLYYGRNQGTENVGKVNTLYPYGRYNDRDYDYYEKDKKTGMNIGLFRYVFDPQGVQTKLAIAEELPSLRGMLEHEITVWQNNVDKGQNVEANQAKVEALTQILNQEGDLHVIWYVVKEVGMQHGWHVDGVLTTKDVTDVSDIPQIGSDIAKDVDKYDFEESHFDPSTVADNLEVDIHLQEHKDWNEIKTSIHIREAVDVTVEIPIGDQYLAEADDFRIRVWTAYYTIDNTEYPVTITTKHFVNKIVIKVTGVTQELIDKAKTQSDGDGITVEANSYYENITHELAWEKLKKATVTTDAKTNIRGQITSAFFTENDSPTDQKVIISYTKADYDHDYPPTE